MSETWVKPQHTCSTTGNTNDCRACTAYWLAHGWTRAMLDAEERSEAKLHERDMETLGLHDWLTR